MSSSNSIPQNHNFDDLSPFKKVETECWAIVPYIGGSNVGETTSVDHQTTDECLAMGSDICEEAQPISERIPFVPTMSQDKKKKVKSHLIPAVINELNNGCRRTELNRRPTWLPVGWTVWKVIRTSGKTKGHIDVYYYSPETPDKRKVKFRAKRELFYFIATNRKREVKKPLPVFDMEVTCELPVQLENWYGPPAGVYVAEVGGPTPVQIPIVPPIEVKTVKIKDILNGYGV